MAYGDNRQQVAADTFDTEISADWNNGFGIWDVFAWVSGGEIETTATQNAMKWISDSFDDDHWASIIIGTSIDLGSAIGPSVRMQAGDNEAGYRCYNQMNGSRWRIYEYFDGGSFSTLATNDTSHVDLIAGDTVFAEAEGITIRVGDDTGGSDTLHVETTDATLSSGTVGYEQYDESGGSGGTDVTSWEGGNISLDVYPSNAFVLSTSEIGFVEPKP